MHIPSYWGWLLTAVFLVLACPCVARLVRWEPEQFTHAERYGDLTDLLLAFAMIAMVSPIGGPIPATGWETILGIVAVWLFVTWGRTRISRARVGWASVKSPKLHQAISALAMVVMIGGMSHSSATHGPWFTPAAHGSTMDGVDGPLWLVLICLIGYFVLDVLMSFWKPESFPRFTSRLACRGVMSLGMVYMCGAMIL